MVEKKDLVVISGRGVNRALNNLVAAALMEETVSSGNMAERFLGDIEIRKEEPKMSRAELQRIKDSHPANRGGQRHWWVR